MSWRNTSPSHRKHTQRERNGERKEKNSVKSYKPNGEVVFWSEPINFVLELPAGKAQELGLKVGDVFQFVENPK